MSESTRLQVADAIVAALKANIQADGGANYWYSPDVVYKVSWWGDINWDTSRRTMYFLRPGPESIEACTSKHERSKAAFWLLCCRRLKDTTLDPELAASPTLWEQQERMKQDAIKALVADRGNLNGACEHVAEGGRFECDFDYEHKGWAVVEIGFATVFKAPWGTL